LEPHYVVILGKVCITLTLLVFFGSSILTHSLTTARLFQFSYIQFDQS